MKLKDAIRILALERDDWETSHCTPAYRREAFDTAIKALEAQDVPDINDGNMIYRQVAIDALERIFDRCEEIESHLPEGDPDRTGYKMYPDWLVVWKYLYQVSSAQPERKKGEWTPVEDREVPYGILMECSECGHRIIINDALEHNYCSECGADMRGEQDENTIEQEGK